ncbi:MAG: HEAT repeat domain-containing protein [Bacteroidetes bacterium]|nr:HEAT repeat domain-containing protein [Bacteroidota bacterium]
MTSTLFLVFSTLVNASGAPPDNGKSKGKDPIYINSKQNKLLGDLGYASGNTNCIEKCIKQNQMASVGFEVIQAQCQQACDLDDILDQVSSQDIIEYQKGVKALCEIDDPRAVQPLITALKRDIKVRTGLWAWIIPALGRLGDSAAVPMLEHTLMISDDHWPGREMSAAALGNIGAPESIPVLLEYVWRGDIRGSVIEALAKFDDQRVIPALISALQPEENSKVSQAATNALHLFGSGAVPELIDAFEDFSAEYSATQKRLRLCHLLGKSSDERAIKHLRESLKDPDAIIAKCASEYVGNK